MADYLKDPVPVLSANNVESISRKMAEGFGFFVEYGMGASTLYFIDRFKDHRATLVSVENTISWFHMVVSRIKAMFEVVERSYSTSNMSIVGTYRLISVLDRDESRVPANLSRRKRWRETLLLGPLYRFSPHTRSSWSLPSTVWRVSRPFFVAAAFAGYFVSPRLRPTYGEFHGAIGNLVLRLRNVPPPVKDQFGESPTKNEYIEAGLRDIREALLLATVPIKTLFVVDGGPRGEIVRAILKLEEESPNFYPAIFLCDAHQAFYEDVLMTRPSGRFLFGTNRTLKGQVVQETPGSLDEETMQYMFGKKAVTKEELAQKEVWFYERVAAKVSA